MRRKRRKRNAATLADAAEAWARRRGLTVPARSSAAWKGLYAAWQRHGMATNPEEFRALERLERSGLALTAREAARLDAARKRVGSGLPYQVAIQLAKQALRWAGDSRVSLPVWFKGRIRPPRGADRRFWIGELLREVEEATTPEDRHDVEERILHLPRKWRRSTGDEWDKRARNPDEDLRSLERAAATGDRQAAFRLAMERERRDGAATRLHAELTRMLAAANGKRKDRVADMADVQDLVRRTFIHHDDGGFVWLQWIAPGFARLWKQQRTYLLTVMDAERITIGIKSGVAVASSISRAWGELVIADLYYRTPHGLKAGASDHGYSRRELRGDWVSWALAEEGDRVRVKREVAERWLFFRENGEFQK